MYTSQPRRPVTLSSADEEEMDGMTKDVEYDDLYDYDEDDSESTGDDHAYSSTFPKVVEPGTEHTGRWTREEHEAFLSALRQYGKEWKKVAARVKTRTVVQTRTHAQKYFQKLQKDSDGINHDGDDDSPDLVITTDFKRKSIPPTMKKEKKSIIAADPGLQVIMPKKSTHQNQDGARDTSQILSNLSKVPVTHTPFDCNEQNQKPWTATHFSSYTHSPSQQFFHVHEQIPSSYQNHQNSSLKQIRIIPPAPEFTLGKGAFPEPSPAACGKRKDMEIAAAELLADVASTMVQSHELSNILQKNSTPLMPSKSADSGQKMTKPGLTSINGFACNLHIVNPEKLDSGQSQDSTKTVISPSTPWDTSLAELVRLVFLINFHHASLVYHYSS